MATTKTATLTSQIDPGVKEALRTAARQEHCSIATMLEVLIRDHCGRNGIEIQVLGTAENYRGGRNK